MPGLLLCCRAASAADTYLSTNIWLGKHYYSHHMLFNIARGGAVVTNFDAITISYVNTGQFDFCTHPNMFAHNNFHMQRTWQRFIAF